LKTADVEIPVLKQKINQITVRLVPRNNAIQKRHCYVAAMMLWQECFSVHVYRLLYLRTLHTDLFVVVLWYLDFYDQSAYQIQDFFHSISSSLQSTGKLKKQS
jgi:hypothetical protein